MSLKISTHFRQKLTSQMLNDRVTDVVGGNALLSGFEVTKVSDNRIQVSPGKCIVQGAIIEETSEFTTLNYSSSWNNYNRVFCVVRYIHTEKSVEITVKAEEHLRDIDFILAEIKYGNGVITDIIQTPYTKNLKEINEIAVKVEGAGATPVSNEVSGKAIKANNTFAGNTESLNIKGQAYHNLVRGSNTKEIATTEMQSEEAFDLTIQDSVAGAVDVAIKGRTLQNLAAPVSLGGFVKEGGVYKWNRNVVNERGRIFFNSAILNLNKTYTLILDIVKNTLVPVDNTTSQTQFKFNALNYNKSQYTHRDNSMGTIKISVNTPSNQEEVICGFYIETGLPEGFAGGELWISNIRVFEGDYTNTPISYLPYGEGIYSVSESENNNITLKTVGKNLLDLNKINNNFYTTHRVDGNTLYVDSTTEAKYSNSSFLLDKYTLELIRGKDIYMSCSSIVTNSQIPISAFFQLQITDADNEVTWIGLHSSSLSRMVTIPLDVVSIKVGFYTTNNSTYAETCNSIFVNPQIEIANERTKFEPHTENTIYVQLSEPLRSLPDGVCDEIIDGKLIRRVGKATIDGSEGWWPDGTAQDSTEETLRFGAGWSYSANIGRCISNNFKYLKDSFMFIRDEESFCVKEQSVSVRIKKSKLATPDIEGFKTWLSQNPTTVYFELAEPVITKISKPTLNTYENTTHISSTNYLAPTLQIDSKGLSKDVPFLKPNTKYSVKFNNIERSLNLGVNLGGSKIIAEKNELSITTPSVLAHNKIYISSNNGSIIKDIMVIEGDYDNHGYIDGIQGVGDKSKNLFNVEVYKNVGLNSDNGYTNATDGRDTTDYFEVEPNTSYVISNCLVQGRAYYDASKKYVGSFDKGSYSYVTFKTPSNVKYVRFSVDGSISYDIQIEKGTAPTPFKPHYDGCKIEVLSRGKNLFNVKEFVKKESQYYSLNEKGNLVSLRLDDRSHGFKYPIKVKPNTNYTLSAQGTTCFRVYSVVMDDKRANYYAHYQLVNIDNVSEVTFSSGKYDSIYLKFVERANYPKEIPNIQLEESSTKTSHELYQGNKVQFLLDEPLMSLPNGICDEIIGNKLIRRVGKVVLDGNQLMFKSLSLGSDGSHRYGHRLVDGVVVVTDNLICNNFIPSKKSYHMAIQQASIDDNTMCGLYLATSDYDNLDDFKNWLSENPTTVYYELKEPIIEELPSQRPLQSFDGMTHILTDTNISPMLSCTLPNFMKVVNQNSSRISDLENILDNIIIPGLIDTDYRNIMFEFDYSVSRMLK